MGQGDGMKTIEINKLVGAILMTVLTVVVIGYIGDALVTSSAEPAAGGGPARPPGLLRAALGSGGPGTAADGLGHQGGIRRCDSGRRKLQL